MSNTQLAAGLMLAAIMSASALTIAKAIPPDVVSHLLDVCVGGAIGLLLPGSAPKAAAVAEASGANGARP